ncbi:sigma-70 family RNA polymerase sigma factor [Amycolatopsis anabasis]|uniref:sigma-70 family RNA polymerase sigma factor n=1 Tax=Amycolatopsis anabasis TaxID=1840409 RepID=UPI00131B149C|nr:sigma-70 family RNA polymerase sigma factor [Amycolatopsis anabasis]
MTTELSAALDRSDGELIKEAREGSDAAYRVLYERHSTAARNLAWHITKSAADVDDFVAEAFARVLDAIRRDGGPTLAFRTYLLSTLRNVANEYYRRNRKLSLGGTMTEHDVGEIHADTVLAAEESSIVSRAFSRLPERWQAVLWHTEIEGQTPTEVAPLLGMTPNAVAVLAYRAREGLRQAYLQAHLASTDVASCQAVRERLGAWARGAIRKREVMQIEVHLDKCERCRLIAQEITDLNGSLRAVVAPLVLGGAAAAYLAQTKAQAAVSSVASTAGTVFPAKFSSHWLSVAGSGAALTMAVVLGVLVGVPGIDTPKQAIGAPPVVPSATPAPPPQPEPVAQPAPTPAEVTVRPNTDAITLPPDRGPADLSFVARNSGQSVSGSITITMTVPSGVQLSGTAAVRAAATKGMKCTQSGSVITCTTVAGLAAAAEAELSVPLQAITGALSGTLTTKASTGRATMTLSPVRVDVPRPSQLLIEPKPFFIMGWWAKLPLDITSSAEIPLDATIDIVPPEGSAVQSFDVRCDPTGNRVHCNVQLKPGEKLHTWVVLESMPPKPGNATVTVTTPRETRTITVPIDFH